MDANRDESFIVELLELKENVTDAGSARWFLEDLTVEQASENSLVCLIFPRNIALELINLQKSHITFELLLLYMSNMFLVRMIIIQGLYAYLRD